jgi:hypothetical protein
MVLSYCTDLHMLLAQGAQDYGQRFRQEANALPGDGRPESLALPCSTSTASMPQR